MRRVVICLGAIFFAFVPSLLAALGSSSLLGPATKVDLVLSADSARPGDTLTAGLRLRMKSGWHVYWRNPGVGIPVAIKWNLPPGVTAGDIQWPVPRKFMVDDIVSYGYEREVVLLVPLTVSTNTPAGPLSLEGDVSWLECDTSQACVPGKGGVKVTLNVGAQNQKSENAALIETWRKRLPQAGPASTAQASWESAANRDLRSIIFTWTVDGAVANPDFFPYSGEAYEMQGKVESLTSDAGKIRIRKQVKKGEGGWPDKIAGLLVQKNGEEPMAFDVGLPIASGSQSAAPFLFSGGSISLVQALLYAFLGGLILNVMPCVLPVIALKILGFVKEAGQHPARVRKLGLIYGAGVLVSFLALAGMVIGVKAAGGAASWGMQLQNPQFVVVMTVVMLLVAMNLFGLFEISLGSRTMEAAGNLTAKNGAAGAFFNGVLATALATPCTAPFLAGALGFAFLQTAPVIVAIFMATGVGLAAPYLALTWQPQWLDFFPKPGPWMERLKIAFGFPILATTVWLFTLAASNLGDNGDALFGIFLVAVALAAWIWGQFVQRGRLHRGLAAAISLALVASAYGYILEHQLQWRHPGAQMQVQWQAWSPEAVLAARAAGRPVIVDFTAKWCVTCQVNVKPTLESRPVQAKLMELNAVALMENSYVKDATVVAELNRYERAGVPLVLVYPADSTQPAIVLPPTITPGIVLDALEKAVPHSASALSTAQK